MDPVVEVGANYVAIIPYGFFADGDTSVHFNDPMQWWGERTAGAAATCKYAKDRNLKVMLKPQLWSHSLYTGHISFEEPDRWRAFENQYREFIMYYAGLADSLAIEMLCIGTELGEFCKQRPVFWREMIPDIREIYGGQLTYAGNWDSYVHFPAWELLDYIGVNAYFPLSDKEAPTGNELLEGWEPYYQELRQFTTDLGIPILFTEYGYRSVEFATKEPWEAGYADAKVDLDIQANAYAALFQRFWTEAWFAGGFLWDWRPHATAGGEKDTRFTPQNKPAMQVIINAYSN